MGNGLGTCMPQAPGGAVCVFSGDPPGDIRGYGIRLFRRGLRPMVHAHHRCVSAAAGASAHHPPGRLHGCWPGGYCAGIGLTAWPGTARVVRAGSGAMISKGLCAGDMEMLWCLFHAGMNKPLNSSFTEKYLFPRYPRMPFGGKFR